MEGQPSHGPLYQLPTLLAEVNLLDRLRVILNVVRLFDIQIGVLRQRLDHSIPIRNPQFQPVLYSSADIRQKLDLLLELHADLEKLDILMIRTRQVFEEDAAQLANIFRYAMRNNQERPCSWNIAEGLASILQNSEESSSTFHNQIHGLYVLLLAEAVSSRCGFI